MNNHFDESTSENKYKKNTADYFFIPVWKLAIFSIFTFGIYTLYWQYKNWVVIKKNEDSKIWPFWRAFFWPFFCYSLFKKILQLVRPQKYKILYSPGLLATAYIVFSIFLDITAESITKSNNVSLYLYLSYGCFLILTNTIFLIIQKEINFYYKHVKKTTDLEHKCSLIEKILLMFTFLILLPLYCIGLLPNKITNHLIIKTTVFYTKFKQDLPQKLSDELKLTDITARPDAIRYHHLASKNFYFNLTSIDTSKVKKNMANDICNDTDIKKTLNRGINFEYSYIVEDTQKEYVVTIDKNDCKKID